MSLFDGLISQIGGLISIVVGLISLIGGLISGLISLISGLISIISGLICQCQLLMKMVPVSVNFALQVMTDASKKKSNLALSIFMNGHIFGCILR